MASLEQRNENYRIVFRFEGRKYSRSLSTNNVTEANGMLASVEQRLKLIKTNVLPAPDANIDIVEYLVHGLSTPIKESQEIVSKFESLTDVCERYFDCFLRSSIEEDSFDMLQTHKRHLVRHIGNKRVSSINQTSAQRYINKRSKEYQGVDDQPRRVGANPKRGLASK